MITMNDILNITCEVMQTTPERVVQLRTTPGAKCTRLATARQLSMSFAYQLGMGTIEQIGAFHNRSHSAVIAASKTVKNDIDTNRQRRETYNTIRKMINDKIPLLESFQGSEYLYDHLDGE
jgi:chromosomal replication initiation ATPase DnaA